MKSIHIRNIDLHVIEALKQLARIHRRSLQGELRFILETAARAAPASTRTEDLGIVTVETGRRGTFSREEIYGDDGR